MVAQIIGGVAGLGFGLYQNELRSNQAVRNSLRAEHAYEIAEANRKKSRAILDGNLTGSLLQTNANNREMAKAEFQKNAMSEASLGVSGTSGGTPFYKLDMEIFESVRKLEEAATMGRLQNNSAVLEVAAGNKNADMAVQNALWNLQDAKDAENYATSETAAFMAGATGAMSGVALANNIESGLRQMGVVKERIGDGSMMAKLKYIDGDESKGMTKFGKWLDSGKGMKGEDMPGAFSRKPKGPFTDASAWNGGEYIGKPLPTQQSVMGGALPLANPAAQPWKASDMGLFYGMVPSLYPQNPTGLMSQNFNPSPGVSMFMPGSAMKQNSKSLGGINLTY